MARSPAGRLGLHTTFLFGEKGEIRGPAGPSGARVLGGREADLRSPDWACPHHQGCYTPVVRIRCPICSTELEVPDDFGPRPFCSVRCKRIDLGNWLAERYTVAEPLTDAVRTDEPLEPSAALQSRPS
jgi:uncharacterized protein